MPVRDDEIAAAIAALTSEEQRELEAALGGGAPAPTDWTASAHTSPDPGPVSRFLAPVGDAAKALLSLPGAVGKLAQSPGLVNPMLDQGAAAGALGHALIDPSIEQAERAGSAFERGDYGEAAGRALASIPVVGPAGAEMGEAVKSGNYAGAAGQALVNLAPGAPGAPLATGLAKLLRSRAAARILDVMRPATGRAAKAESIAEDLVMGVPGRETAGGIGVGTLKTLSDRAATRATAAGQDVQALQALDTPIDVSPVSRGLRDEAKGLVSTPPPREVLEEVATGLLDEAGDPIMGVVTRKVKGKPTSEHKPLVSALRTQARSVEKMAGQYEDELIPAGELFKQRAAAGRRHAKAYRNMPGDEPAAVGVAGKAYKGKLTKLLHEEVPASVIPDREYEVFRTAATNFERRRLAALTNRGWRGLRDLLAGRAVGAAMGAGAGMSFGPLGGVAGALGGAVLGESAYWGSLRAATYAKLSHALNNGRLDEAAEILQRTAAAYAADKAIRERERHRKAQEALRGQAEGVVAP